MDINAILQVIVDAMTVLNVPAQLGQNFLDFSEFMLLLLLVPITLFQRLFGG